MGIDLYEVIIALFKLGAKVMLVDPSAGLSFMESCFELERPTALITTSRGSLLPLISKAVHNIPYKFTTGIGLPGFKRISHQTIGPGRGVDANTGKLDLDLIHGQMPALVTFTSGSTGRPKGIVRTHDFLLDQHKALENSLDLHFGEIELTALPVFVLANLASGMTTIIPDANLRLPARADAGKLVRQLEKHHAERIVAPPALLERLVEYCTTHRTSLRGLKKVCTGGGPVFPKLMRNLKVIAPGAQIVAVYGSTEAEPIACIALSEVSDADLDRTNSGAGLLAGCPEANIELRIIRPLPTSNFVRQLTEQEFNALAQPVNVPGEIVVSGRHVIKGYSHGEGDSQTKFKVGNEIWHRTGDAGYLDSTDRLWLLGRENAKITDRYGTLYPFQVEAAACQRTWIRHAACVSFGGRRTLVVEPADGFHSQHRTERKRLPELLLEELGHLHIEEIQFCNRIPTDRRHNSKVVYAEVMNRLKHGGFYLQRYSILRF
jgi:acyl-CoA synthetase (AMP-forming)/AMP-acid ligase II